MDGYQRFFRDQGSWVAKNTVGTCDPSVAVAAARRIEYNEERSTGLGYQTPREFAQAQAAGFYTD